MKEPLSPTDAKRLIVSIVETGTVRFSKHADVEMRADGLDDSDARRVLRGGVVEPAELREHGYTYRVRTSRMYFVVAFLSEENLLVVTAWRRLK